MLISFYFQSSLKKHTSCSVLLYSTAECKLRKQSDYDCLDSSYFTKFLELVFFHHLLIVFLDFELDLNILKFQILLINTSFIHYDPNIYSCFPIYWCFIYPGLSPFLNAFAFTQALSYYLC